MPNYCKDSMKYAFIFCLLVFSSIAIGQKKYTVSSPDNNVKFSIRVSAEAPSYSVFFKEKPIIDNSIVSLSFLGTGQFKGNLKNGKPVFRKGEDKYELPTGRSSSVHDYYNEMTLPLYQKGPDRQVNFIIKDANLSSEKQIEQIQELISKYNWMLRKPPTAHSRKSIDMILIVMHTNH